LAAAYHAYKVLKDSGKSFDPVLPGLHQFSPEALFFISAGRSFCSKPLSGTLADAVRKKKEEVSFWCILILIMIPVDS
jgi:hypothetical protein